MSQETPQRAFMLRYLLEEMSEEEQALFEARYFNEPAFLEELQLLRAELLEDYVTNDLTAEVQAKLSARLARSPLWRDKVAEVRALYAIAKMAAPATNPQTARPIARPVSVGGAAVWLKGWFPAYGWAALISSLVLLFAGWFLLSRERPQQETVLSTRATPTSEDVGAFPAVSPTPRPAVTPAPKQKVATFALAVSLNRAATEVVSLKLPAETAAFELHLDLGAATETSASSAFRVAIVDAAGASVWQALRLTARSLQQRRVLILRLPTRSFPPGNYQLQLHPAHDQSATAETKLSFKIIQT